MRQSPGSMRRGTTAGGTTALTDDSSIPPAVNGVAIVRTSRIPRQRG